MKISRIASCVGVTVLALFGVTAFQAANLKSLQIDAGPEPPQIDVEGAANRLATALQFRTISHQNSADGDLQSFRDFHIWLRSAFPSAHSEMELEMIGGEGLLFRWPGSDLNLDPVLFVSHQDVVPVEPGTESEWTYPAFEGTIADGYIWGRGTLDVKSGVCGLLEAAEALLREGFKPRREVWFFFGQDEEVMGHRGARAAADLLKKRGIRFSWILDEGGFVVEDILTVPLGGRPVAWVNTAEKSYCTLRLTARGEGGHSSTPPAHTAVGKLASAIHCLEANPFPLEMPKPLLDQFRQLAPECDFLTRWALSNLWLTEGILLRRLASERLTAPLVRTTTAATVFHGGIKENVVPQVAEALVNFRILPGTTPEDLILRISQLVDNPDIDIEITEATFPPVPASTDGPGWVSIAASVRAVYPEAVVVPGIFTAATDSRHFRDLAPDIYRFSGVRVKLADVKGAHGTDERIGVESYAAAVRILAGIIRHGAG